MYVKAEFVGHISFHSNTEAKQHKGRKVLGWDPARERMILKAWLLLQRGQWTELNPALFVSSMSLFGGVFLCCKINASAEKT